MNTAEFLRFILPETGVYFLATPLSKGYAHTAYTDVEIMAEAAIEKSRKGNVFFACSSFDKPEYVDESGKKKWRTTENAKRVKAQWIDIDCSTQYGGDKKEALKDLFRFVREAGIPRPSAIVDSGNGLHAYWVFDREIPKAAWQMLARTFKGVAAALKFATDDTTRTADVTSVLRPIGTNNDKAHKGLPIKPVKLVGSACPVVPLEDWVGHMKRLKADLGLSIPADKPKNDAQQNLNSDLGGGLEEYPESSARTVALHCNQIRLFADFKGNGQSEPLWRACLGVVKHCIEGTDLCQEWSSGHPGYSPSECQEKISAWSAGPTTCEYFKGIDPAGCASCPHKVKSPIQLGRVQPEAVTEEVIQGADGEEVFDTIPEFPAPIARNYMWTKDGLCVRTVVDGATYWTPFSKIYILPIRYYRDTDNGGVYKITIETRPKPGDWRMADISAKAMQGGNVLLGELAEKCGVTALPGQKKALEEYMSTWFGELQINSHETSMHSRMGWQEDGSFLVGRTLYDIRGGEREVFLATHLRKYEARYEPKGNIERYAELINFAYDRPRHEAYQFTWLAGFASPLISMLNRSPLGIVFAAWSPDSGYGKSTAAKLAAGIWHDPEYALAAARTTAYAMYLNAGYLRNLPLVVDEVTGWGPKAADFAYDYSSGRAKEQGRADGGLRDNSDFDWNNCAITTANKSLYEMIQMTHSDCIPQLMRVFEYRFDTGHAMTMDATEGMKVITELMSMRGIAGQKFIRHVMRNLNYVEQEMNETYDRLLTENGLNKDARFWVIGASAVWVAFKITKELGLHNFDEVAMKGWISAQFANLKLRVSEAKKDMGLIFADMILELQAGFIVTLDEGHKNSDNRTMQIAPGFNPPRGDITGRVIINKNLVYVAYKPIKDWCVENGVSVVEMREELKARKWLLSGDRYYLGKGTMYSVPQTRVMTLDWTACAGMMRVADPNREEKVA